MPNDFVLGLQVTVLGMGMVFVTLVIVMVAIMLLDRLFPPAPEALVAEVPAAPVIGADADPLDARGTAPSLSAMAAAVAVSLALTKRASTRVPVYEGEVIGEIVTVPVIDPGPATWTGYGRIKAVN
ncbi:MAG: OadG-related small transporter subunit [Anaerolineae bacterium]